MKILLLEDEYILRKSIKEFLEEMCHYSVVDFSNGNDALEAIFDGQYDLFLLDVNVPELSGFELLAEVRKNQIETPAIFITSYTEIDSLEKGFKLGCNDYIRKPFDLIELKVRISTALKQAMPKTIKDDIVELGSAYSYNIDNFTLTQEGREVVLSKTEKMILNLLVKHKNHTVSQEMIRDYVWEDYVDPANIRVQINNLRKKLPKDFIKNIRGVGYRLET